MLSSLDVKPNFLITTQSVYGRSCRLWATKAVELSISGVARMLNLVAHGVHIHKIRQKSHEFLHQYNNMKTKLRIANVNVNVNLYGASSQKNAYNALNICGWNGNRVAFTASRSLPNGDECKQKLSNGCMLE